MFNHFYKFLLLISISCCLLSAVWQVDALTLDQLVNGVNLSRLSITSGEVRAMVTEFRAARKSPEEIQEWMQERRQKILNRFPEPIPAQRKIIMEELLEAMRLEAAIYGEQKLRWELKTAFQLFDNNSPGYPTLYRYRICRSDRNDIDLYSFEGRFYDAGKCDRLTYDGEGQLYEQFSQLAPPMASFAHGDRRAGFYYFHIYGRSSYQVPKDGVQLRGTETINGSKCYILEFQLEKPNYLVKIWVEPTKQFCVCREHRYHAGKLAWSKSAMKFRMYGDIWYPTVITREHYSKEGKMTRGITISVKEAQFNVGFPEDFFHVDAEKCFDRGMKTMLGSAISKDELRGTVERKRPGMGAISACGPKSLLIICERMGIDASFDEIATLSNFKPGVGTSMWELHQAARKKGLNAKGIKVKDRNSLKRLPLPAIAYLKGRHFIVVEKVIDHGVIISDPSDKYANYLTMQEFYRIWDGEILIFGNPKGGK